MRHAVAVLAVLVAVPALADEPKLVVKPDAFATLVNPNCSHCVDEAKRRATELKPDDPVLVWSRGYSDGGAIPFRFFLAPYRVISDSYGVFVYDPDAGFARGFAPGYTFVFHGWRNGVMVIKDTKDGTLFSALTGLAFDGPRKGQRLEPVPTIVDLWGSVMERNPNAVAYHMFDKYRPVELPTKENPDAVKTRPAKADPRLKPEELVLGVRVGDKTKAYPLAGQLGGVRTDAVGGEPVVIFTHSNPTRPAAYRPTASQPRKYKAPRPDKDGVSPPDPGETVPAGTPIVDVRALTFKDSKLGPLDHQTDTAWGLDGRGRHGPLKDWTLDPVDAVVCKWVAWSAEYPDTEVDGQPNNPPAGTPKPDDALKEIAGAAEFLRLLPKPFATLKAVDAKARTVTLLIEGETVAKVWPVEPDAEVKVRGWWGRLEQLKPGDRVWVWLKLNRNKQPVAVAMIADEPSEQDIHGDGLTIEKVDGATASLKAKKQPDRALEWRAVGVPVAGNKAFLQSAGTTVREAFDPAGFEAARSDQKAWLAGVWEAEGLPGTVSVQHTFSGELEIHIDHEGQRWARSLVPGSTVHIAADPPIKAVVRAVAPWRERTQLRLVVGELAAADLKPGERVRVKMTRPALEVLHGPYPPDIDRPRAKAERVEWFLASTYCTCKVTNNICTGHFYTLASCNPNGCAAPNETRKRVAALIDAGKTDREVWDELLAEKGPLMLKPHLLP